MIPTKTDIENALVRIKPIITRFDATHSARLNHKQKMDLDMIGQSIGLPKMNYFCSSCVANNLKRVSAWQKTQPTKTPQTKPTGMNADDLKGLTKKELVDIAKTNNVAHRGNKAEIIERLVKL